MSSAAALELLLDPAARVVGRVTVPEGRTVPQTLQLLAEGTEIPLADFEAAAADPAALGLPEYAQGNLEGFLFPATYEVEPGTTAPQVLTLMIDRFEQAAETVGLEAGAERLGRTPYEVVIVASLIEREVKFDDEYGQVARVVYNRLDQGIPLGIDAAVAFGVGKVAGEELTKSDLARTRRTRTGARPACRPRPSRRPVRRPSRARSSRWTATSSTTCWRPRRDGRSSPTTTRPSSTSGTSRAPKASSDARQSGAAPGGGARAADRALAVPVAAPAAYTALGLDWQYDAVDVGERELPGFLDGLGPEWAGLSLTMPLKTAVLPLLDDVSDLARDVAAANTVVLRDGRRHGDNTDVPGIVAALAEAASRRCPGPWCWAAARPPGRPWPRWRCSAAPHPSWSSAPHRTAPSRRPSGWESSPACSPGRPTCWTAASCSSARCRPKPRTDRPARR
jgi:hypothetical protein